MNYTFYYKYPPLLHDMIILRKDVHFVLNDMLIFKTRYAYNAQCHPGCGGVKSHSQSLLNWVVAGCIIHLAWAGCSLFSDLVAYLVLFQKHTSGSLCGWVYVNQENSQWTCINNLVISIVGNIQGACTGFCQHYLFFQGAVYHRMYPSRYFNITKTSGRGRL